jgi:hypothetical protein
MIWERLAAGLPVTRAEVTAMGIGGLLHALYDAEHEGPGSGNDPAKQGPP